MIPNFGGSPVTKQYKFGTSASSEGNRRSGFALAMRHRLSDLRTHAPAQAFSPSCTLTAPFPLTRLSTTHYTKKRYIKCYVSLPLRHSLNCQKVVCGRCSTRTPLRELLTLSRSPSRLGVGYPLSISPGWDIPLSPLHFPPPRRTRLRRQ